MPDRTCAQCGQPLSPDSRFCSRCGAVFANPDVPVASGSSPVLDARTSASATLFDASIGPSMAKASKATVLGFAGVTAESPAPAPSTPGLAAATLATGAAVATTPDPIARPSGMPSAKQTMIGVAAVTATPAPTPEPRPGYMPSGKGTMLGVAIPGIAPLAASAPAPEAVSRGGGKSTMLGVAVPGVAPVHSAAAAPGGAARAPAVARPIPKVLPKPAPLVDDEPALGPSPRLARRGIPLAYVAGGVFGVVLVFGTVVALLWKGQSLVVVPRQDAQDHEQLHLQCESCQDGTTATLDGVTATFNAKEADLLLATPLKVGDNPISIHLSRPRLGRDEDVQVVVPIAYRIKTDPSTLSGAHPTVTVRVQAVEGAVVTVADKPVPLDAHGEGAYAIDVGTQTTGWSDDLKLIDQSIPYTIITPARDGRPGSEKRSTLPVRAGIATLHLDAPGISAVIEGSSFRIAGHTVKGGTVTLNGQPVATEADGSFSRTYDAPTLGDLPMEIRADGPQLASRTAHFTVKRVGSLAAEAKTRERAPAIDFAVMTSGADAVGKTTIVEGDVGQARAGSNQIVAIVDDRRGCADGGAQCLVRVVYAGTEPVAAGDHVRVYGHVTGVLPASSTSAAGARPVPVVEADFLVKGRSGGR